MPALHIRDVPEPVLDGIRRRAHANRRSVEEELLVILGAASEGQSAVAPLDLIFANTGGSSTWSREEIYGDDERR